MNDEPISLDREACKEIIRLALSHGTKPPKILEAFEEKDGRIETLIQEIEAEADSPPQPGAPIDALAQWLPPWALCFEVGDRVQFQTKAVMDAGFVKTNHFEGFIRRIDFTKCEAEIEAWGTAHSGERLWRVPLAEVKPAPLMTNNGEWV